MAPGARSRVARLAGFVLALAACCAASTLPAAHAQPASNGSNVVVEHHHRTLVVDPDGSFTETIEDTRRALDASGVAEIVQRLLPWNASTGTLEILEAYTIKADGSRIAVPGELIREEQEPRDERVFRDLRYTLVSFPDVEPGDSAYLRARHRRRVPLFPWHFFDAKQAPVEAIRDLSLVYDLPASMDLRHDAIGFELERIDEVLDRRRYRWRYTGARPTVAEGLAVSPMDHADRLFVSTFVDYRELAWEYVRGASGRAAATPEIRALALELTRAARSDRERAARLHDWVRQNVRFGGSTLAAGAVVPKHAHEVFASRAGDCKDHATLLEALLSSVGISSSPVMINAGNAFQLPSVPTLGVFNHVITWIPSLQLFVDSSAAGIALGQLPTIVSDKPALIVKTGELSRTPPQAPLTQDVSMRASVADDGLVEFQVDDAAVGWLGSTRRRFFSSTDNQALDDIAIRLMMLSGLAGRATLRELDAGTAPSRFRMRMTGKAMLPTDAGVVAAVPLLSAVGAGIATALSNFHPSVRHRVASVCIPVHVDERARWRLPAGTRAAALPGALDIRGHGFRYRARYAGAGGRVTVERSLRLDLASNVCSPAQFRAIQRLSADVYKDLDAAVLLRRGAGDRGAPVSGGGAR